MIRIGNTIIRYVRWQGLRSVSVRKWMFHAWNPFEDEWLETGWSDVRLLGFEFERMLRTE